MATSYKVILTASKLQQTIKWSLIIENPTSGQLYYAQISDELFKDCKNKIFVLENANKIIENCVKHYYYLIRATESDTILDITLNLTVHVVDAIYIKESITIRASLVDEQSSEHEICSLKLQLASKDVRIEQLEGAVFIPRFLAHIPAKKVKK